MTTRFRNVDFDPGEPLDSWPAKAIETVIHRGALWDWRQLADAIRRNPWGTAARTAETVVGWGRALWDRGTDLEVISQRGPRSRSADAPYARTRRSTASRTRCRLLARRDNGASVDGSDDERTGARIVLRALEEPLRQLAENAGLEGSVVVNAPSCGILTIWTVTSGRPQR